MKNDIDFDELDKAVSSLMGAVSPSQAQNGEASSQKTLSINTTLQPDEKPRYDKLDEVAKAIGSETLVTGGEKSAVQSLEPETPPVTKEEVPEVAPKAPEPPEESPLPVVPVPVAKPAASRPAGGRFMDVVHPSSAMRSTARESTLAQPANPTPAVTAPDIEQAKAAAAAPDVALETPLTPFLPDAKVEKRPLGGGAVPSPFTEQVPGESTGQAPAIPATEEPQPVIQETISINSEKDETLHRDSQPVLDATSFQVDETQSANLQAIESRELDEPQLSGDKSIHAVESGDTEHLTTQSTDTTPGDTPEAAKPGGIYDVKDYHQPLDHPKQQKSGWGVVVIIIIVIVLAAALGAAAYFILGLGV